MTEKELVKEEKLWGMFAHLSSLAGFFTGIGFIVGPLIVWLVKKDESAFVDAEGKESLNFQISMLIYYIVAGLLSLVLIGLILIPILAVYQLVIAIIAAVKAKDGQHFRYPLTIRFIK